MAVLSQKDEFSDCPEFLINFLAYELSIRKADAEMIEIQ